MSAVSYQTLVPSSPVSVTLGSRSKFSEISVGHQEMVKIFNQRSGNRIQGMCKLEKGFDSLFPLFKGMVSLGKPNGLEISHSNEEKSIFFSFDSKQEIEVGKFISNVLSLLRKEVRFKKVLKEIIENRQRFRAEQSLLHSSLLAD